MNWKKIASAAAVTGAVAGSAFGLSACSGYGGAPYVTARYECAGGTGYCVEYSDYSYEYVPYSIWDQVYVGALISRNSGGSYSLSRSGYSGSYTRITSTTHLTSTSVKPFTLSKGASSSSYSKPSTAFKSKSAYKSYKSGGSSGSSTSRSGSSSYKSKTGGSSYKSHTSHSSFHSSSHGDE